MGVVLISGITGQDGAYLADLCIRKGHNVVGVLRSKQSSMIGLNYLGIKNQLTFEVVNVESSAEVTKLIRKYCPDYIFNLAGQSSVAESFRMPIETMAANVLPVANFLEGIRLFSPHTAFYQAGSSDMFGSSSDLPLSIDSELRPVSPYAVSKVSSHHLVQSYRSAYGIRAANGILFNHESVLRRENFFIMKLIRGALDIQNGKKQCIEFGNLDVRRDFGYAPDYVEAMYLINTATNTTDYLVCSGRSYLLKDIVYHVFNLLGLEESRIVISDEYNRPNEIQNIYGTNERICAELGWSYTKDFFDVVNDILKEFKHNIYERNSIFLS